MSSAMKQAFDKAMVELQKENAALKEALQDVFALIDEGHLVRSVAGDGDPMWALKAVKFVERLKRAHEALGRRE